MSKSAGSSNSLFFKTANLTAKNFAVSSIIPAPIKIFKAQKTIAQSLENKANFHKLMDSLSGNDIERIRKKSDISLLKRAFSFFDENKISSKQLAERLRREFDENCCISVNEEKEKENQQILLNSLEDRDNQIRAIFLYRN